MKISFSNYQAAELQSLVSPALARRVSPIWFGHYGAFTSDGSPVHYVKLQCDVRLFAKTCSEEELTHWYVCWMEQSLTLLNACNRPGTPAACWSGMVEIIDLSGLTFSQLHPSSLQMLSRILKVGSQHYPENLRCAYVIGAPSFFAGGWAVVSQALAPATVAKISVRSDDGGAPLATLLGGEAKLAQLRASGAPTKLEQSLAESRKSAESQATVAASGCLGCPVRCLAPPPTCAEAAPAATAAATAAGANGRNSSTNECEVVASSHSSLLVPGRGAAHRYASEMNA